MNGWEYEELCARYLKMTGYGDIQVTKGSGDFGCDILATKDGKTFGVQCKYYESSVGVKAVSEAAAGALYYKCDYAMVITNSIFTKNAKEYAQKCNVILLEKIDALIIAQREFQNSEIGIKMKMEKVQDSIVLAKIEIQKCLLEDNLETALNNLKSLKNTFPNQINYEKWKRKIEKRYYVRLIVSRYMCSWHFSDLYRDFKERKLPFLNENDLDEMVAEGLIIKEKDDKSEYIYLKPGDYKKRNEQYLLFEEEVEKLKKCFEKKEECMSESEYHEKIREMIVKYEIPYEYYKNII